MLAIGDVLISEDVLEKKFVCDLQACKGACCVQGDAGAPLTIEEASILDDIYEDIKWELTEEGRVAIEKNGKYEIDSEGDLGTTLVEGKHCAYAIFDNGVAKCGIENACKKGLTNFQKPVSCHLYPIRIKQLNEEIEALNYHQWDICAPACQCGDKLQVPVYKFLKTALIRKYGAEWYEELNNAAEAYLNFKTNQN